MDDFHVIGQENLPGEAEAASGPSFKAVVPVITVEIFSVPDKQIGFKGERGR
jgi:hypothetical protein